MWDPDMPWSPSTTGRPGSGGGPARATASMPPATGTSKYVWKGSLFRRPPGASRPGSVVVRATADSVGCRRLERHWRVGQHEPCHGTDTGGRRPEQHSRAVRPVLV